jgi:hypothetical protein
MSRTAVRRGVVCALAWLAVLAGTAAPASASANDVRVTRAFFGVHDRSGESYAAVHEGSVRLWDVGVRWEQVETARGVYDWTRLDELVRQAQAAHARVTMVVAGTPSFYASDPTKPPSVAAYKTFVRALMRRYRDFHGHRGISAYQVWNEGNVSAYWTGTPAQLAGLTRAMWQVRNRMDTQAKVIAPPMVARVPAQIAGLVAYHSQRVHGHPVRHYYDAVALSLYPLPTVGGRTGVPEDSMGVLRRVRAHLRALGMPAREPIWATEINYGLPTGNSPVDGARPISEQRQMANVARTYLLGAANGLARMFWYRYDMRTLTPAQGGGTRGNTLLSDPGDPTLVTPAGKAYALVQHWMHGRLLGTQHRRPCRRDTHGTYTCTVQDGKVTRRIYWNPFGQAAVRLATGARTAQSLSGAVRSVKGGARLTVDYRPVMVTR